MKMCGIRRTASTKCVVAAWLATVSARLQLLPSCSIRPQLIRHAQRGGLPQIRLWRLRARATVRANPTATKTAVIMYTTR